MPASPPLSPRQPTAEDVARARELLLVELLGDFPFADQASRAHAVAAGLLPFVRRLIEGPTPLHLYDAPVEGTGKGLLANVTSILATGREAEGTTEAGGDEEWRKKLTPLLLEGPTFILLDNLNRALDLAALPTPSGWWTGTLSLSPPLRR